MLLRLALFAAAITVGTAQSLHANISFVVGEWRCRALLGLLTETSYWRRPLASCHRRPSRRGGTSAQRVPHKQAAAVEQAREEYARAECVAGAR